MFRILLLGHPLGLGQRELPPTFVGTGVSAGITNLSWSQSGKARFHVASAPLPCTVRSKVVIVIVVAIKRVSAACDSNFRCFLGLRCNLNK
jgi:hypothetical protein